MASPQTNEGHTLMLPIVIAIIVYVLLHLAINGLLRLLAHRKTQIIDRWISSLIDIARDRQSTIAIDNHLSDFGLRTTLAL